MYVYHKNGKKCWVPLSCLCDPLSRNQHIQHRQPLDIIYSLLVSNLRQQYCGANWTCSVCIWWRQSHLAVWNLEGDDDDDDDLDDEDGDDDDDDHGEVIAVELKDLVMDPQSTSAGRALFNHLSHIDSVVFVPLDSAGLIHYQWFCKGSLKSELSLKAFVRVLLSLRLSNYSDKR